MRCRFKICILFLFLLPFSTFCQSKVSGTVHDSAGHAIAAASVSIIFLENEAGILFTRSNDDGHYSFLLPDSLLGKKTGVRVNAIGYKKIILPLASQNTVIDFLLLPNTPELPQVTVKNSPSRIVLKSDTLSYNTADFSDRSDRFIGDIIRKIPGIEITENGTILYQGRAINYFYIDGDNILDDKYAIATKNIPAQLVDKIQVIENNQHIKMLNGIIPSEIAGLNITIKDNARLNMINTGKTGIGTTEVLEAELNNLSFKPRFKSINLLKYNNSGRDLSDEVVSHTGLDQLGNSENRGIDWLLASNTIEVPGIQKQRYLFNHTAAFNINEFFKNKKELSWRINGYFISDRRNQTHELDGAYYLPGDTAYYKEKQQLNANSQLFHISVNTNKNTAKKYFNNTFSTDINPTDFASAIITYYSPVAETLTRKLRKLSNSFNGISLIGNKKFIEYFSYISYESRPEELNVKPGLHKVLLNNNQDYSGTIQQTNLPAFFTNNYLSYKTNNGVFFQNYKAGFLVQSARLTTDLRVQQPDNSIQEVVGQFANRLQWNRSVVYAEGDYRLEKGGQSLNITIPLNYNWIQYSDTLYVRKEKIQRLLFTPSLQWRIRTSAENILSAGYYYRTQLSNINEIYSGAIMETYQNFVSNDIPLQQTYTHNFNTGFNFRRSIKMLFISASYTYAQRQADFIYAYGLQNNIIQRIVVPYKNTSYSSILSTNFSKYLFALKTNFFARYVYQYTRSYQLQNNYLFPVGFYSHNFSIGCNVKPVSALSINFESRQLWYGSRRQTDVSERNAYGEAYVSSQKMELNVFLGNRFSIRSAAEYYDYQQPDRKTTPSFFLDAGIFFKVNDRNAELEFSGSNLTNQDQFSVITASANYFSTGNFLLRPRMVVLRFSFGL